MSNRGDNNKRNLDKPLSEPHHEEKEDMKLWGILLFGLIGATATTAAIFQMRRTVDWVSSQLFRTQSSWKGKTGGSSRTNFQDEAWKKFNRRMQEEYEEEMERVERIRRMQSVFNRERSKYKRSYETWEQNSQHGQNSYNQHFQRNDWYWKSDPSFKDRGPNYSGGTHREPPRTATNPLSHHYSVLGLERVRTKPYTDAEIKSAFRTKAKQFHPDQNQENKDVASTRCSKGSKGTTGAIECVTILWYAQNLFVWGDLSRRHVHQDH